MKIGQHFDQCVIEIGFAMILMHQNEQNVSNRHRIIDENTLRRSVVVVSSNQQFRRMLRLRQDRFVLFDDDRTNRCDLNQSETSSPLCSHWADRRTESSRLGEAIFSVEPLSLNAESQSSASVGRVFEAKRN